VAGTYVSVELMPEIRGYQAQAAQPLVIGEPNSQAQEIFEINARAFDRACAVLKPGATWGEVEDEVTAIAHGTPYEINLLLHGRGLGNDGPLLIPAGPARTCSLATSWFRRTRPSFSNHSPCRGTRRARSRVPTTLPGATRSSSAKTAHTGSAPANGTYRAASS
jgi:Xaa-Pro aminopeptidase